MRKSVYLLGCVLLIFLMLVECAGAEYPLFHHDPQRTGFVSDAGPGNNTIRWSSHIGEFIGASPVVEGGRIYVGVWPDMTFQPGEEYYFSCLDVASGAVIWKNPLGPGEGTVSGAAVSGDRVYVGCMDGKLYCIDKMDGTTLWSTQVDIGEPDGNWYGLSSCPVVYNGLVYVTSLTDGTLHAFTTSGTEVWKYATGKRIFAYSSPAIDNDRVYFGTDSATSALYCVDINTHKELWNVTSDRVKSSPVISGNSVFFTSTSSLEAVDKENGRILWSRPISASWGTPAVAGGHLYLGTKADSALHSFSTNTGAEEWKFTANGKVDTSPVVAGNTVYFASNCATGTIYAVDTSGRERWHHTTTNYLMSSPSVSDGALFIGSDEGTLYAFGGAYVPPSSHVKRSENVTLVGGSTFSVAPINSPSTSITVNRTSALGALDAAATAGTFDYTIKTTDWGPFINSIGEYTYNETTWDSWMYMVNGVTAEVGAADYTLTDGDQVIYWYGAWGSSPATSPAVITINVAIPKPTPTTPSQKIPGSSGLPTDPDGDGLYEDMNGNGVLDFNDVVLFFNQMDWISDHEPISAFDFNANGQIDFNDIVGLFNSL